MAPEEQVDKSPNEILAELVVGKLRASGFLAEEKCAEVLSKIKDGSAGKTDWELWVSHAISTAKKGDSDG